ncbi:MAG: chemotaxis-specific protein-glutamate methyltransferase CheB [Candidatus Riflebacteria bacterium]|nr:chemotaxis-specific protein-glutamate methyltransferase CheB [Candidatus Riflebacteria bacterium]
MPKIRVLVVDDSCVAREIISSILTTDQDIEIVGEAVNGMEAVEKATMLKPDIVTMDIEMPIMNGLLAIEQIMSSSQACPILVISSTDNAQTSFEAIEKGALELIPKSELDFDNPAPFIKKVKNLARVKVIAHVKFQRRKSLRPPLPPFTNGKQCPFEIIAIASSTGGPFALSRIISKLRPEFPLPIVIAQHIVEGFALGLAEWLQGMTKLVVKIGEEGEVIKAGTIYISPPERNMIVSNARRISLVAQKNTAIYHPSCNSLLSSVADVYGSKCLGTILTGMGDDGVEGAGKIREAGGKVFAQDEKTSVVFGMPKVAIERGFVDQVLPLEGLVEKFIELHS